MTTNRLGITVAYSERRTGKAKREQVTKIFNIINYCRDIVYDETYLSDLSSVELSFLDDILVKKELQK